MTSVAVLEYTHSSPLPRPTVTAAATSRPAVTLRLDVEGGRLSVAHGPGSTLMYPLPCGVAAVTLIVRAAGAGRAGQRGEVDGQHAARVEAMLGDVRRLRLAKARVDQPQRSRRRGAQPVGPIQPLTSTSTSVGCEV